MNRMLTLVLIIALSGIFYACQDMPNNPAGDYNQPIVVDDGTGGGDTGGGTDVGEELGNIQMPSGDDLIDTEIPNVEVDEDGTTLQDLIYDCWENSRNHGQYVSCIAHLTRDMVRAGIITGAEKGVIDAIAARSEIGK